MAAPHNPAGERPPFAAGVQVAADALRRHCDRRREGEEAAVSHAEAVLRASMRVKALAEIYTMHSFALL